MLSTGELSKKSGVSVRTVQFYDKKGILKPSHINEKGYRFYDEEAELRLNYIVLYKNLGFTLSEIKILLDSNDFSNLITILDSKIKSYKNEINLMEDNVNKLNLALEIIKMKKNLPVSTIQELEVILKKKEKYTKITVITNILLITYIVFLLTIFPIFLNLGGIYTFFIIIMAIFELLGLIYFHSASNAFICPKCGKKFNISFFKDLVSLNGGKKGKKLKCPYCEYKGYFKETFKD